MPNAADPQNVNKSFQTALLLSDEGFAAYIANLHKEVVTPYRQILESAPARFGKELSVLEPLRPLYDLTVNYVTPPAQAENERVNYIGIRGDTPMDGKGSIARASLLAGITLPSHSCISCSAPHHLARGYNCDDLGDTAQVRASQLDRAFIALHEVAHNLFPPALLSREFAKQNEADINPLTFFSIFAGQLNERQADIFAASVFIKELGEEGAVFIRQYAAGFRYNTNGTGADHDTALALAKVLERYEQDPDYFKRSNLNTLMNDGMTLAESLEPPSDLLTNFAKASGLSLASARNPDEAYKLAQARLAWRQGQPDGPTPPRVWRYYEPASDKGV